MAKREKYRIFISDDGTKISAITEQRYLRMLGFDMMLGFHDASVVFASDAHEAARSYNEVQGSSYVFEEA